MAHEAEQVPEAISAPAKGVQLTPVAIERLKEAITKENLAPGAGVRLAVTGGGCSGMSYAMNFETEPREDDQVVEADGIKIFVDEASIPYLDGTTVDYVVGLHKEGFKFLNPKASRTCGCGESFAV